MLLLMPKRKAGMFSTDDARRKTARVELERYERLRTTRARMAISRFVLSFSGMKGCVLRGKGWLFPEVRIPKNVDIFVYDMQHED